MTTESSSPAARDGTHDFELLDTKPALMSLDESTTQRAEDVGHLHGGPAHSFFFRPDRLIVSMVETVIASTGLVTECRCWAIPTWKRHPFICTCRPSICIRRSSPDSRR